MTTPRDEFEAWAKERGHPLCDVIPKYGPASSAPDTVLRFSDIAWEAYLAATERAAKVCEARADTLSQEWRQGHKTNQHLEGQSDGAFDCAAAIRSGEGRTG